MSQRYLFVAGCPRSGTSALAFLLNEHPQIALGFERYKRVRAQLDPFHFTPAQFFSPVAAETDIRGEMLYERLQSRWRSGTVKVVGDKVPLYTRVLPQLLRRFPRARVAVMVREPLAVAASFVRRARDPQDWWPAENDQVLAIAMWNEALAAAREAERSLELGWGGEGGVALCSYEAMISGQERWLEQLLSFVGVPMTDRLRAEHERLAQRWSARGGARPVDPDLEEYVRTHVDQELWEWAGVRMAGQFGQDAAEAPVGSGEGEEGPSLMAGGGGEEPPLTAEQVQEREREREQLLQEMRRPGTRAPEETQVLERRLLEQAGELARRGERLWQAGEPARREERLQGPGTAAPARSRPRVTFILPHQRASTGGVYVIEQFARHLAEDIQVCLAVRQPPSREVPGVEVRWAERLDAETLPRADLLVYPADLRDAAVLSELPAKVGAPVLFFQGYGTPGSPVVQANLAAARASVAIAHWLVEEALRYGTPCAYVPQGLDRMVFAPGPRQAERAARVSIMTHGLDWKGLQDALDALALVRAECPDLEVVLFGSEPVEGLGPFRERPARAQVAELLRASAVHMVASWEEGFGLIGAEAIACGAALATTDTKGSRDYAVDGCTALVSPPRDVRALAENVLRLLGDVGLRERLTVAGQRHQRATMPPWPEAARRMALALGCATAP